MKSFNKFQIFWYFFCFIMSGDCPLTYFRYSQKGELIETRFPVWTEKGQEYIKNLIKGSRQKDMIVKIQKQVKKDGKNC